MPALNMAAPQRLLCRFVEALIYGFTVAKLWLLDRIAGPMPETEEDRHIREEGERLRRAFPQVDFDDPTPRTVPPNERA